MTKNNPILSQHTRSKRAANCLRWVLMASVSAALMVLASAAGGAKLRAAPLGGTVSSGNATISTTGATTTINQASERAAIDWTSFDLSTSETANFVVPASTSTTLNRITGGGVSTISGTVSSNGSVYFVNPNGMVFDATSRVSANGFIASTANISNFDFMRGSNFGGAFTAAATVLSSSIDLKGDITVAKGGAIAIVGPNISNSGRLSTSQGSILLAGATGATISFNQPGVTSLTPYYNQESNRTTINLAAADPDLAPVISVTNSGSITNDGGQINILASGLDSQVVATVTNSGTINAKTLGFDRIYSAGDESYYETVFRGQINLSAARGQVLLTNSSVLDVSGPRKGGTIIVGGDGADSNALPNSNSVVIANGSLINADGLSAGAGGKIAIWAIDSATIGGTVKARSRQNYLLYKGSVPESFGADDSGAIAISSRGSLNLTAQVDSSAPEGHGAYGTVLLDQNDIMIVSGTCIARAGTVCSTTTVPDSVEDSFTQTNRSTKNLVITVDYLVNLLNKTNVVLRTNLPSDSPGATTLPRDGGITVAADIRWTGSNSLTLQSDTGGIYFTQSGRITAPAARAVTLATNGGMSFHPSSSITVGNRNSTLSITAGRGGYDLAGTMSSGGNLIVTLAEGSISVPGSLSSGGALTVATGKGSIDVRGTVTSGGGLAIAAAQGSIGISGTISSGGDLALATASDTGYISVSSAMSSGGVITASATKTSLIVINRNANTLNQTTVNGEVHIQGRNQPSDDSDTLFLSITATEIVSSMDGVALPTIHIASFVEPKPQGGGAGWVDLTNQTSIIDGSSVISIGNLPNSGSAVGSKPPVSHRANVGAGLAPPAGRGSEPPTPTPSVPAAAPSPVPGPGPVSTPPLAPTLPPRIVPIAVIVPAAPVVAPSPTTLFVSNRSLLDQRIAAPRITELGSTGGFSGGLFLTALVGSATITLGSATITSTGDYPWAGSITPTMRFAK